MLLGHLVLDIVKQSILQPYGTIVDIMGGWVTTLLSVNWQEVSTATAQQWDWISGVGAAGAGSGEWIAWAGIPFIGFSGGRFILDIIQTLLRRRCVQLVGLEKGDVPDGVLEAGLVTLKTILSVSYTVFMWLHRLWYYAQSFKKAQKAGGTMDVATAKVLAITYEKEKSEAMDTLPTEFKAAVVETQVSLRKASEAQLRTAATKKSPVTETIVRRRTKSVRKRRRRLPKAGTNVNA